jgi:4a-hydroxytetrahydrobiopterin dehydratase
VTTDGKLSRQEISEAISGLGWRYVLAVARTSAPVGTLAEAVDVAGRAVAAAGADADGHLQVDLRADRVILTVRSADSWSVTPRDLEVVRRVSAAVRESGLTLEPGGVQALEVAIDAIDIAAVRPFWKAVLGYDDEPAAGPLDAIVDPVGQGPAVWFQQMSEPRPQRNRIHLDVSVPHDEAARRIKAVLAAGGVVRYDAEAPAFWVLADVEGNEACVTTWQGRDALDD